MSILLHPLAAHTLLILDLDTHIHIYLHTYWLGLLPISSGKTRPPTASKTTKSSFIHTSVEQGKNKVLVAIISQHLAHMLCPGGDYMANCWEWHFRREKLGNPEWRLERLRKTGKEKMSWYQIWRFLRFTVSSMGFSSVSQSGWTMRVSWRGGTDMLIDATRWVTLCHMVRCGLWTRVERAYSRGKRARFKARATVLVKVIEDSQSNQN
ncbi:hypothetical protein FB451DRAFT_1186232 [Mycena latifolia]|nr:hypothetical protein FB451DRAFT_1186232 [Mycena latifolia]